MIILRLKERAAHLITMGRMMIENGATEADLEEALRAYDHLDPYRAIMAEYGISQERCTLVLETLMEEKDRAAGMILRRPIDVIDKILEVFAGKPDTDYQDFRSKLCEIRDSAYYRAPEAQAVTWELLAELMADNMPSSNELYKMDPTFRRIVRIFTNDPHCV